MFLEFVEGPLWYFSATVFVVGVLLRLVDVFRQPSKRDLAQARRSGLPGAMRAIVTRSWTAEGFSRGATFHLIAGYMFHIGLFVLLLFAAPHVKFIEERILGFGWAPAPYWVFIVASQFAFAGLILDFAVFGQGREVMAWAHVVHGIVAVVFIAASLGHIYIGTLGMEGAFESMSHGYVDANWAEHHHDLWLAEMEAAGMVGVAPNALEEVKRHDNIDFKGFGSPGTKAAEG